MKQLKKYKPTRFMLDTSHYDEGLADYAVSFIECLCHTKGTWAGKLFKLLDWQEQIIRDLFGIVKPNGYRQFNTAYIEIPKKNGKSELAAAVALLLCCGDGEQRAEIYGCAADRGQATIVFDVAADMVRMCPALNKRCKILTSQKRILFTPTNSFYQVLSAEAYALIAFVAIDYITGVMCAISDETLSSEVGFKGICRKVLIFLLVGIGNIIDVQVIGNGGVMRTAVIFFYLSNEGISLIENAAHLGLPVPDKLKAVLEQLHDRAEKGGDE